MSIQIICLFFELFILLLLICQSSLCILDIRLTRDIICKYFLLFCVLSFHFVSFEAQKFFILMKSNLSLFSLVACDFNVTFMKPLPNRGSQRFIPMFFYKSFIVVSLTLRSLIHFELICVYGI